MKRLNLFFLLVPVLFGCAPEIGDECTYDVDCSGNMDRNCDNSQPGGYCLIIDCGPDECPEEASCVTFTTPCPTGDVYVGEDSKCSLIEPNRGRSYCLKHCRSNKDCREKYQCVEPQTLWAAIIDFSGSETKICLPLPE